MSLSRFDWRRDARLAYLLVNLATLLWAGNIALGRALRGQIGPLTLTALRVSIAGLLLVWLFRRLPAADRRLGRDWPSLLGMALTGVFGFPALLYLALNYTTASNAALINGAGPLMTALLAAWLLRERLTPHRLAGALVSLAGVFLIVGWGQNSTTTGPAPNLGDLIMLVNVALWGVYSVLGRVATRSRSTVSATAFSVWLSLPFLYPAAAGEWRAATPVLSPGLVVAVLFIGIFPAFVSFLAWNEGVRRAGPAGAMAFYNMLPVYGALLAALFLGETLGLAQIAGGVLVITGGLLAALALKPAGQTAPADAAHNPVRRGHEDA
ncbi:MAG: DMT family transporter [Chloroflexi bacterium]|nr:DMT family transporter [Chloroflexota bacterium]